VFIPFDLFNAFTSNGKQNLTEPAKATGDRQWKLFSFVLFIDLSLLRALQETPQGDLN